MNNSRQSEFYMGFENLYIAVMEKPEDGIPKWNKPVHVPNAVGFAPTNNSREYNFFADNKKALTMFRNNGASGDLEVASFPPELLVSLFGWVDDGKGGLLETVGATPKQFALLGEVQGDQENIRFVYYCCSGSIPEEQYSTMLEDPEVKTRKMTVTASPIDLGNGVKAVKYSAANTTANKAVYDGFFDEVYNPAEI